VPWCKRSRGSGRAVLELPAELQLFLRERGVAYVEAHEVTARHWASSKRAFRLELADGRRAKARLLLAGRSAERIMMLLDVGGASRHCSRVIAGCGRCMLEEWIEGDVLSPSTRCPQVLFSCGRALADIHSTPVPAGLPTAEDRVHWPERVRDDLRALGQHGLLKPHEVEALLSIAGRTAHEDTQCGVVHLDFSADNIVMHHQRGPVCVDNETVRTGPFALDVARTLTRWPLEGDTRQHLLDGYASGSGPADLAQLDWWTLVADAWSAALRVAHGHASVDAQLAALRRRVRSAPGERH